MLCVVAIFPNGKHSGLLIGSLAGTNQGEPEEFRVMDTGDPTIPANKMFGSNQ
jgi:hypothetical protein